MLACVFLYTLSLHLSFSMMRLTLSLDALNHGAGGTEVGILIGLQPTLSASFPFTAVRW